jgi:hypothetical protein
MMKNRMGEKSEPKFGDIPEFFQRFCTLWVYSFLQFLPLLLLRLILCSFTV